MRSILLIAQREYLSRIQTKSFVLMTLLIPVILGLTSNAGHLMSSVKPSERSVSVDLADPGSRSLLETTLTASGLFVPLSWHGSGQKPQQSRYSAVVQVHQDEKSGTFMVVSPTPLSAIERYTISAAIDQTNLLMELRRYAPASAARQAHVRFVVMSQTHLAPRSVGSTILLFLMLYFVILFYGMNVARSVAEEKQSRVYEVILSCMYSRHLMAGKLLGVGAVGLSQISLWMIAYRVWSPMHSLLSMEMPFLGLRGFVGFGLAFLLGYMLYSSVACVLGAISSSERELQQLGFVLMLPLIACAISLPSIIAQPDGALAHWLSSIPFSAPLIMHVRINLSSPPLWEIGVSLAGVIATIGLLIFCAGRIYRGGIAIADRRPTLADVATWIGSKGQ